MSHISTPAEIQSGHDRQQWAEGLIIQLPANHDGRNSWLMNYGRGKEAQELRRKRHLPWSDAYCSAYPKHIHAAGTLIGEDIDTCAHCGADIRNEIHHDTKFSLPLPATQQEGGGA
jgi:hypothetical protein